MTTFHFINYVRISPFVLVDIVFSTVIWKKENLFFVSLQNLYFYLLPYLFVFINHLSLAIYENLKVSGEQPLGNGEQPQVHGW